MSEDGDGTVPVHSARHLKADQNLPYTASHGDLYVYPPLLEKLHYETINRFRYSQLASAATGQLRVHIQIERDAYNPGETIQVNASINMLENSLPVYEARIEVNLTFHEAIITGLSNSPSHNQSIAGNSIRLQERTDQPGVYSGYLTAPRIPGYYALRAKIYTRLEPPIDMSEIILVEP